MNHRWRQKSFVEFKIYISLKRFTRIISQHFSFVEFKIYISLKHRLCVISFLLCFVEFKIYISLKRNRLGVTHLFSFVEFKIYISLKRIILLFGFIMVLQNSKFTYLSNIEGRQIKTNTVLQNSKFTYLSNQGMGAVILHQFCRIQNLHISQTVC